MSKCVLTSGHTWSYRCQCRGLINKYPRQKDRLLCCLIAITTNSLVHFNWNWSSLTGWAIDKTQGCCGETGKGIPRGWSGSWITLGLFWAHPMMFSPAYPLYIIPSPLNTRTHTHTHTHTYMHTHTNPHAHTHKHTHTLFIVQSSLDVLTVSCWACVLLLLYALPAWLYLNNPSSPLCFFSSNLPTSY